MTLRKKNIVYFQEEMDIGASLFLGIQYILNLKTNNMAQQTAIEWLVEQYEKSFTLPINDVMTTIIEQAKQMEKEQILDAICTNQNGLLRRKTVLEAIQYYEETYRGQESPHANSKFITNIERSGDGTIIEFLLGTRSYDGVWFGEEHPRLDGRFWWRPILKSYVESVEPEFGSQGSPDTSPNTQNK